MKTVLTGVICLLLFQTVFGQSNSGGGGQQQGRPKMPAIGHIYGKVIDAKSKEEVPFASVAIFKKR